MTLELGIIEGYYGKPWSWADRMATMEFLAPHGYRFYMYAPKADPHLRRLWREPHPADVAEKLRDLCAQCREAGVRFGIGLSPSRAHQDFGADTKGALARKLELFSAIGIDDFAVLFDDMRGDSPDLAERQANIVDFVGGRLNAERLFVCPSYYTDDPVLDRVFGARPAGYLEQLGKLLDPRVEVFWTGEEVVSREFSEPHLARVSEQLDRKPFLWDNYPVNDGERMSQYLHVRGFTGRPAWLRAAIAGHGINPALQPTLTRIPALTLAHSYARGRQYVYGASTLEAAIAVLGDELGQRLYEDMLLLNDDGLDRLGEKATLLRERYGDSSHPGAREIIAWLDGEYRITDAIIHAQSGDA